MSYYERFKVVLEGNAFRSYLAWAYRTGIEDLGSLGYTPNFSRPGFTALLCGVGNEGTADLFIQFVKARAPTATIWIVDLGIEQIEAVRVLVQAKYPNQDIRVLCINALHLDLEIPPESVDWIETDGVLEFFDTPSLKRLMSIWTDILRSDGFITTRDFSPRASNWIGKLTDALRIYVAKRWLGVQLFRHTREEFFQLFAEYALRVAEGSTVTPTYRRFAMIRDSTGCDDQANDEILFA